MKKLILTCLLLTGCLPEREPITHPLSCMDGYLLYNEKWNGFCKQAYANENGIVGSDCYGVSHSSPRANIQRLIIKEGYYVRTQCYNADRDN